MIQMNFSLKQSLILKGTDRGILISFSFSFGWLLALSIFIQVWQSLIELL